MDQLTRSQTNWHLPLFRTIPPVTSVISVLLSIPNSILPQFFAWGIHAPSLEWGVWRWMGDVMGCYSFAECYTLLLYRSDAARNGAWILRRTFERGNGVTADQSGHGGWQLGLDFFAWADKAKYPGATFDCRSALVMGCLDVIVALEWFVGAFVYRSWELMTTSNGWLDNRHDWDYVVDWKWSRVGFMWSIGHQYLQKNRPATSTKCDILQETQYITIYHPLSNVVQESLFPRSKTA